jgi:4-hydroxy-3-methylbut-2-enyl diphosphate reductase
VLSGHATHAEVEGTMGRFPSPIHLVQPEADVENIGLAPGTPIAFVSRTTLSAGGN